VNDDLLQSPTPMKLTIVPSRRQLPARAVRAHALKNCLAIVDSVNELVACELSEEAQLRLARSRNAVRRMAKLIDEDLRPESDAYACGEPTFVPSAQVLGAVRARLEDLAEAKRVGLEFRIGAGGVLGDCSSLVEALANVVKNSIESSPAESTVVVTSFERAGAGQLWTVRDSGHGIPRPFLSHLGVAFCSQKVGGSGVGFAVACDIFQAHGARVRVESAEGWGTLVSIALPRMAAG
jgi:signal transduction histidine kinase